MNHVISHGAFHKTSSETGTFKKTSLTSFTCRCSAAASAIYTRSIAKHSGTDQACLLHSHIDDDRHLRPRYGFIEHIEIDFRPQCRDGTLSESSRFRRWFDKLDEASRVWQKPIAYDPSATEAALQRAGFVDIQRTTYELPFTVRWSGSNETPVPAAQLYRASFENGGLEGMCMAQLTRPLPENDRSRARSWNRGLMTPDEVEYLADQVRAEMRDPRKHVYNVV